MSETPTPRTDAVLCDSWDRDDAFKRLLGLSRCFERELATLRATLATRDGEIAELRKAFAELERGAIWSAQTDTKTWTLIEHGKPGCEGTLRLTALHVLLNRTQLPRAATKQPQREGETNL